MFKECLAMLNLRKWSLGRPDTHGYRSRSSARSSVNVLLEEIPDEDEPTPDAESLLSFAKVADSDISENEFENENFFGDHMVVSLSESIPESNSFRSSRSSTNISSQAPSSAYRSQRSSTSISSAAPSFQSSNNPLQNSASQRSSTISSPSPSFQSSNSNRNSMISREGSSNNVSDSYTQQIITLLKDSTADLATLPDIRPPGGNSSSYVSNNPAQMQQLNQSMQRLSTSQNPTSASSFFDSSPNMNNSQNSSLLSSGTPSSFARTSPQAQPSQTKPQSEEDQRCVVCLDAPRNSILYQCGHVCVCNPCGKELISRKLTCPMCRAAIKDCIILYK